MKTGTVLDKIADSTRRRVEAEKRVIAPQEMRRLALAARKPADFAAPFRRSRWGVIAEVKLASPSEGALGKGLDPVEVARQYAENGASAISVLTEPEFFHGSLKYLAAIRSAVETPLLMKDFILEEYQMWQGRAGGADAVLLIAALIGEEGLGLLIPKAKELGLTALVEVHDEEELEAAFRQGASLIGVNNRNLKTLQIDLGVSRRLARAAKDRGAVLICESGIGSRAQTEEFSALGYAGFLIGTHFIKTGRPGAALAELLDFAGEGDEL